MQGLMVRETYREWYQRIEGKDMVRESHIATGEGAGH